MPEARTVAEVIADATHASAEGAREQRPAVPMSTNPKDAIGRTKTPFALIPGPALVFMARVFKLGAEKYGAHNWRLQAVSRTVYLEAGLRHILAALDGENADAESKQLHEAHAMACMAILLDAYACGTLLDDRPPPGVTGKIMAESNT